MKEIFERRSIRRYTDEPVPEDLLEAVIKAGMYAPSAGNEQPWEFVVISERDLLDKIAAVHPHARMLKEAPAAIVVCGDIAREKHKDMWSLDCAAATENMLLEISFLGLGGVWLGVYPRPERMKEIKKLLLLPEKIVPFSIIALGFPAERKMRDERFMPERIHYNFW